MTGEQLREKFRAVRDAMPENHRVRLHRAISWFRCAEGYAEQDDDISFIALWIALNSCYSIEDQEGQQEERSAFKQFASTLVQVDEAGRIYECLWSNYSSFVKSLMNNHYVFPPFWTSQVEGNQRWEGKFETDRKRANTALAKTDVPVLLSIVFDRLYTLRNQLVHGGATYQGKVNRSQIVDGRRMLQALLPIIVELMFDAHQDWGQIRYPPVAGR